MAVSPAHRFGQIIGEILEQAILPLLQEFAKKHGLYLDKHGSRPCRQGQKCVWKDLNGNSHDLDFVLERGGSAHKRGMPVAFIETAWRRYTKHSRNKAQEIQGAILPLVETYRNTGPFMGAVLAGVFTEGALTQLKSLGFTVLYFPYESVAAVFRNAGIAADFDEGTPDADFQRKVEAYERMPGRRRKALARHLLKAHQVDVDRFLKSLTAVVYRQIERIIVLPLHGKTMELRTVDDAVRFIQGYGDPCGGEPVERYEILIRYNNGDKIEAFFRDKESAVKYLRTYQPLPLNTST
jgi:hypothetical protein